MPEPITPPADNTPPAGGTPPTNTPPAGGDSTDWKKKAEELEAETKKVKEEYQGYRQKVDPVLETLYTDAELLRQATVAHNKRLGRSVPDNTPPTPPGNTPPGNTPPAPPAGDPDNRNATINILSNQFESKVGIDKLPSDKQAEMRGKIGTMLKEMLDPKGNKTIAQVFEEVSLTKLPWYLERAYDLVTKDQQIASAKEQGKNEVLAQYEGDRGMIGGMPSGSVPIDQVVLTPDEKKAADRMGISHEDYLKSKKEMLAARG